MATSINVRLDNEKEEKLKQIVSDLKENAPAGVEINNSTVVRGAIDNLLKSFEEDKKGTKKVAFNFKDLSEKELNYLIAEILPDLYEYQSKIVPKELLEKEGQFRDTNVTETPMINLQELLFNIITQLKLQVLNEMTDRLKK